MNKEEQELIDAFMALKSNTTSGAYGMQFNAIIDALALSAKTQLRLKGSIDELVGHSKILVTLTRILIFLTAALIVVGFLTIFYHPK